MRVKNGGGIQDHRLGEVVIGVTRTRTPHGIRPLLLPGPMVKLEIRVDKATDLQLRQMVKQHQFTSRQALVTWFIRWFLAPIGRTNISREMLDNEPSFPENKP